MAAGLYWRGASNNQATSGLAAVCRSCQLKSAVAKQIMVNGTTTSFGMEGLGSSNASCLRRPELNWVL